MKYTLFFALVLVLSISVANCQYEIVEEDFFDQFDPVLTGKDINTMPFVDYCYYYGYPVETHKIHTKDLYILTYFRIQAKNSKITPGKPVVYLQHGLIDASDNFITNEESLAMGFILANQGFDVWFGNSRGNKHSKEHEKYKVKSKEFWAFSWQQIADYDLPAAFKYIGTETNQKINYIGHSQGTSIMFAALSENNSEVKERLNHFIALAPVSYLYYSTSEFMQTIAKSGLIGFMKKVGIKEFLPPNQMSSWAQSIICGAFKFICDKFFELIASQDTALSNKDRYPVIFGHYPSGGSTQTMDHWMQMLQMPRKVVKKYDYGEKENMKQYGQKYPPEYDMKNIEHPSVHLFVGNKDKIASVQDVEDLVSVMKSGKCPNVTKRVLDDFDHGTFMWAKDMSYFDEIVEILKK